MPNLESLILKFENDQLEYITHKLRLKILNVDCNYTDEEYFE